MIFMWVSRYQIFSFEFITSFYHLKSSASSVITEMNSCFCQSCIPKRDRGKILIQVRVFTREQVINQVSLSFNTRRMGGQRLCSIIISTFIIVTFVTPHQRGANIPLMWCYVSKSSWVKRQRLRYHGGPADAESRWSFLKMTVRWQRWGVVVYYHVNGSQNSNALYSARPLGPGADLLHSLCNRSACWPNHRPYIHKHG